MRKCELDTADEKKIGLLPYSVIEAVTQGDVDAINAVLKHYEGYIAALSTRVFYDENGASYSGVDLELKRRLETKLITRILKFSI